MSKRSHLSADMFVRRTNKQKRQAEARYDRQAENAKQAQEAETKERMAAKAQAELPVIEKLITEGQDRHGNELPEGTLTALESKAARLRRYL